MVYKISEKCISCGACAGACPMQCISQGDERYVIAYHKVMKDM